MLNSRQVRNLIKTLLKIIIPLTTLIFLLRTLFSPSSSPPHKNHSHHHSLSAHLILATTTSSNLTWLDPALKNTPWKQQIYITDLHPSHANAGELTVPVNKGNEAMAYLTYIVDNYENLPDVMFFHHDHAQAWHQQFSSSFEIKNLNFETVVREGYVSPRCLPGCENVIELPGDVVPLEDLGLEGTGRDVLISTILREFYGEVPSKIAAPCCAQFAVSRDAVRRRPKENWVAIRKWLERTDVDGGWRGGCWSGLGICGLGWRVFFVLMRPSACVMSLGLGIVLEPTLGK
ncbi:hypothetical protein B0J14DRAFT_560145 [Halenospora varia]|nr:hypothetical protein B0J14DRAFT_560145 [Halenospora varia]